MGGRKHVYRTPTDCRCRFQGRDGYDDYCAVCDGGLAVCKVCGLAEGELTTECPGDGKPWHKLGDAVRRGHIDFWDGRWVRGTTAHLRHLFDPARLTL